MSKPQFRALRVHRTVQEQPDGRWLVRETAQYYKTAHGAHSAFKRDARRLAKANPTCAVVQVITWVPKSWAGRMIAEALAK